MTQAANNGGTHNENNHSYLVQILCHCVSVSTEVFMSSFTDLFFFFSNINQQVEALTQQPV